MLSAWGLGHVLVEPITTARIYYTCKYHVNRGSYPSGALPPFALMSTKPAIGISYVNRMREWHRGHLDRSFYPDHEVKKRLPRIFKDRLYSRDEKIEMAQVFEDDLYSEMNIIEFKKKYPHLNYFQYRLQQIQEHERKYLEKSNYNSKL